MYHAVLKYDKVFAGYLAPSMQLECKSLFSFLQAAPRQILQIRCVGLKPWGKKNLYCSFGVIKKTLKLAYLQSFRLFKLLYFLEHLLSRNCNQLNIPPLSPLLPSV